MATTFDAIIIGTGQAGPFLAQRLTAAGRKVAIIERKLFGGTCVNTGCIPTKTLIASAYAAQLARRGAEFGVDTGNVAVDMKRVKARKDEISGRSNTGVENWLRTMNNCTVYTGHARFESSREVRVGDETLTAGSIFINVGGRAVIPELPGIGEVEYFTNSTIMPVDFLPRHLVIVGGSYIGLEFGQMYRRFGSEVTIIEMGPRLIHREDEDVSQAIQEIVEREGIHVHLNAKCIQLSAREGGVAAHVDCTDGPPEVAGSHLLLAVGRRPNTDDLGLEKAGVETDQHGYIRIDDQLRTNVPGIWALGDCNGKGAFTHTSFNDAEIASANIIDNDPRRVSDRIPAYALYIDPPLGRAGMTEKEALSTGRPLLVGKRPMTKVGRAVEKGESQGFMKIVIDAETKRILGAAILGTGGDEAIHSILDVMYAKAPYTLIQRAVHIHPTVSELIPTMLGELKSSGGPVAKSAPAAPVRDGITSIASSHSVDATLEKLQASLRAKGVKIFAVIDHSGEAAAVGMPMRNTKLIIFGNPKAGTPLMLASPTAALDLPLKILIWEDANGQAWLTFNTVEFLRSRHGLPENLSGNIAVIEALAADAAR